MADADQLRESQEQRAAARSAPGGAGERIEAIAFDLATGARVVPPDEVHAAIAAHRDEVLVLATEFRIPCPEPADPGRPEGAPVLQPNPLVVRKNTTGHPSSWEDRWMILNPNLFPDRQVWTGQEWRRDGELDVNDIFRWSREEAVAEALRLAVEETARFEAWLAEMRAGRSKP